MYYLLLFHGNNGYANAPQYYVIRTLPVLLMYVFVLYMYFRTTVAIITGGVSFASFGGYEIT